MISIILRSIDMSTKKLNEALGIGDIDDFLSDLDIKDDIKQFDDIDEQVQKNVENIDNQIQKYEQQGLTNADIYDISQNLTEIKELIEISKNTIRHVYDSLVSSELVDSELVSAFAKLMESTKLTVGEYITLYKDRLAFYDKVRLETLKHKNDMEKIKYKHDLDMEKLNSKVKTIDVSNNNSNAYTQEDIIKMLEENN